MTGPRAEVGLAAVQWQPDIFASFISEVRPPRSPLPFLPIHLFMLMHFARLTPQMATVLDVEMCEDAKKWLERMRRVDTTRPRLEVRQAGRR
jgi:hypothetical protein